MISFIIPSFNSSNTIKRAVESILNQTSNIKYEIIIVDDGSSDNTEEVLKCYDHDERVKYYKKENSGVADTRNYGVLKAVGDYIIFVDSDDYISENLLNDIERFIRQGIELIKWNVRNYAIKKDLMVEFPSGTYHEDFATMPLIIFKAKSFVSITKREYFYVQSENSIMRGTNTEKTRKKLQDKLSHFDNLIKTINELNLSQFTKENFGSYAANSMLAVIKDLDREEKTLYKKELKKRKIWKFIKVRNMKQLIKRIIIKGLIIV